MIKVRVYAWNPNGTNDIEIVDTTKLTVLETVPIVIFCHHVLGHFNN